MKNLKKYALPAANCCLTLLSALFWVALRVNYSGISKFLGADTNQSFLIMNLPVLVCIFSWLGFFLALLGWKRKWTAIAGFAIGLITAVGAAVVVYFGAYDYLEFILVHFYRSLAAAVGLTVLALLLFFPVTKKSRAILTAKGTLLLLAVAGTVIWGYQLRLCDFTYGPVVYAVEDDYQIVFSTSDSALGWVTINGQNYYDLYAGSARSADRVHKVTVPQEVLDTAGSYAVHAQQMIYRGPFGGYKGRAFSQVYAFYPVNPEDGISYAALSDVHGAVEAAAKAASSGKLDFLVLLGDLVDMVETEKDAQLANRLAHAVTGGTRPVIYVRGNHEIKGEYGERLYKYVGSLDQGFAYTVTLADTVYAAVLDMGEDHEDDWWEYYGTAHFDLYRQQQTDMLKRELESGEYRSYPYRMALCHIPVPYVDEYGYFGRFRREWTKLLNDMEMDISLSGHEHRVWYFLPDTLKPGAELIHSTPYAGEAGKAAGGTVTNFTFPTFLVGRRSLTQLGGTQKLGMTDYLGLHTQVDLAAGTQTSTYISSHGTPVPVVYPFETQAELPESDGARIVTELK